EALQVNPDWNRNRKKHYRAFRPEVTAARAAKLNARLATQAESCLRGMRASAANNRRALTDLGPGEPYANPTRAHWESPTLGFDETPEAPIRIGTPERLTIEDEMLITDLEACRRANAFGRD